jgi:hypothetical protein
VYKKSWAKLMDFISDFPQEEGNHYVHQKGNQEHSVGYREAKK